MVARRRPSADAATTPGPGGPARPGRRLGRRAGQPRTTAGAEGPARPATAAAPAGPGLAGAAAAVLRAALPRASLHGVRAGRAPARARPGARRAARGAVAPG